jgi:hypothetical protein
MSLITWRDMSTSGDPIGPTYYLEFDSCTLEEFNRPANVTQYPTELGVTLSDHYQPLPLQITIAGVVSDTPSGPYRPREQMRDVAPPPAMIDSPPLRLNIKENVPGLPRVRPVIGLPSQRLVRGNIERATSLIPQYANVLRAAPTATVNRILFFVTALDGLQINRVPVNVLLFEGLTFQNMFITSARPSRVSGAGGQVTISVDLEQVLSADPAQETPNNSPVRTDTEVKPKRNRGAKNPYTPVKSLKQFEKLAPGIRDISRGAY